MSTTPPRLFLAAGFVAFFALPAAAQNDAGRTLRLVPHADLSIRSAFQRCLYHP
jgi:hypothetical protein